MAVVSLLFDSLEEEVHGMDEPPSTSRTGLLYAATEETVRSCQHDLIT